MTPYETIGLAVLLVVAVGFVWALVSRQSFKSLLDQTVGQMERERSRTDAAAADAARLPDIRARADRAERSGAELLQQREGLARQMATLETEARHDREMRITAEERERQARSELDELANRLQGLRRDHAAIEADRAALRQQDERSRDDLAQSKAECDELRAKVIEHTELATRAASERDAAMVLQKDTAAFLDKARIELRASFTEAASKVFDEKAVSLEQKIELSSEKSRLGLETTLKPFQESVSSFRERLESITTENTKGRAELVGKIDELKTLNQGMTAATDSLTKALKGNAKIRGDWGELVLDTVLKSSGLVEGTHYSRQPSVRDEDMDKRRTPDVVVLLPDGRKVVVDSKVNLVAWAEATNTDDPQEIKDALWRHATGLRTHVRELSDKNYPALVGPDALQITIAFVPIEGALSHALNEMADLQTHAFSKKVVFATPNTLMTMLQVVDRLWVRDKQQRQVETIALEAEKLLDALTLFLSDFEAVEKQVDRTSAAVAVARRRLDTSPQSVTARARRMVLAGARGKKNLAKELVPEETPDDMVPLQLEGDAREDFELRASRSPDGP